MSSHEEIRWFNKEVIPCEPALRAYLQKRFPLLHDHDDLVQESYHRLLRARRNGRLNCAKAFLFTVARNLAIDTFRRRHSMVYQPLAAIEELPALADTTDVVVLIDHQQELEMLIEAMDTLPERCREVMMLRFLDGLSYREIADYLGLTLNTVKTHLKLGVRSCTAFFENRGLLEITPADHQAVPME